MNETQYDRTLLLLGEEGLAKLRGAHVAIFGLGGVGGAAAEALARAGVGTLTLVDKDVVTVSNLNRQIIALHSTLGQSKVSVLAARIRDIDPTIQVHERPCFFLPETADQFAFSEYDYVLDAVDTVTAKLEIIIRAKEAGTRIISAMGAGNKLDPGRFEVADLADTEICPLARVLRKELKKRGITHLKVVYSREKPISPASQTEIPMQAQRPTPGSVSFVPPVAGYLLAGEIVHDLLK